MKKQILSWILALILMLTPVLAIAEGGDMNGELAIDGTHVYPNMDKSYENGYTPRSGQKEMRIILPLVGTVDGDVIHVSLELPKDGTFDSDDLAFDVAAQTFDVKNASEQNESVKAFLIDCIVPVSASRVNGTHIVRAVVSYRTRTGEAVEQTFHIQTKVTNGKSGQGDMWNAPTEKNKPLLLVRNCRITPDEISGGEQTHIDVFMINVGDLAAKNIRISLVPESDALTVRGGLNAQFFDALPVNAALETSFDLDAAPGAAENAVNVALQLAYEDKFGEAYTEEYKYSVRITQPKVEIAACEHPTAVNGGESFAATVTLKNTGTGEVKDVVLRVVPEDEAIVCADRKDDQTVPVIEQGKETVLSFNLNVLPDAAAGNHAFRFECAYTDVTGMGSFAEKAACSVIVAQPKLEITKTVYSDIVEGGESFSLTLTLRNAGTRDARDVVVTYTAQDESIRNMGTKDCQTLPILKQGESADVTFDLRALPSASEGRHEIRFDCVCTEAPENGSAEGAYPLFVLQKASLGYDEIRLPETITSGESFTLPICVYNTGFSQVYNVRCTLNCDGLICSSAFLGNLAPQQSADKTVTVFVTTLSGTQKYGEMYGNVEISFEDENGERQFLHQDVKGTILEPVKITDEEKARQEKEQKEQQTLSQWWISLLVAIAVIIILVAIIVIARFARLLKMK